MIDNLHNECFSLFWESFGNGFNQVDKKLEGRLLIIIAWIHILEYNLVIFILSRVFDHELAHYFLQHHLNAGGVVEVIKYLMAKLVPTLMQIFVPILFIFQTGHELAFVHVVGEWSQRNCIGMHDEIDQLLIVERLAE